MVKVKVKVKKEGKAAKPKKAAVSEEQEIEEEETKPAPRIISPMAKFYSMQAEEADKSLYLMSGQASSIDPVSSGSLIVDLILNGGFHAGLNQISGIEGGGKTTLLLNTLAQSLKQGVPLIEIFDAEGTISPKYAAGMFSNFDLDDIFEKTSAGGGVNYYREDILEVFADKMSALTKFLPDKMFIEELNQWAYVVNKGAGKQEKKIADALRAAGLKENRKASSGNRWVFPTDYNGAEAAIYWDSIAAMLTSKVDEEGTSNQMAGAAAPLAKQLPRFVGKLTRKGIMVYATNQMRQNPGDKYNPWYEVGGNTLKHATSSRMRLTSISPSTAGETRDPKKSGVGIEDSITHDGGYDRYMYKKVQNTKNKWGVPMRQGLMRVWISDAQGRARGIDPFWDTYQYLKETQQISGKKTALTLNFRPSAKVKELQGVKLGYYELKKLVLAEHFENKAMLREVLGDVGLKKAPNLRRALFAQIRSDEDLTMGEGVSEEFGDIEEEDL